ncbi:MAG: hypothetical protein AB7Q45_15195 [Planctomycetaceae bacterium]
MLNQFPVRCKLASAMLLLAGLCFPSSAGAQFQIDQEPINYETALVNDRVARLARQLDSGEVTLARNSRHEYLPALLEALRVPISSQMLVFSKTSAQLPKISPSRPRALYFNDDTYVGWVQGGDFIEISSVDPQQGAVFYTMTQPADGPPRVQRDKGQCLICHASSRTEGVPGQLVRSLFVDKGGQPMLGSGTYITSDTSPFAERWGGWYVTGTHGAMRHMGNVLVESSARPEDLDRERGANVRHLAEFVNTGPYLTTHSDIVALMVLEHQSKMQNLLTRANYEARAAAHMDGIMNEALDRPDGFQSESTQRRIATAGEAVLKCLFFAGEFALSDEVAGTSSFQTEFQQSGPRDSKGRSLRDFDLKTRLFRYPCSFLIDSPSIAGLPAPMHAFLAGRIREILNGEDRSGAFDHLSREDRRAIREILQETGSDLF